MLIALLTGCGGGGSDSGSTPGTTPSSASDYTLTVDKFGEGIVVSDKSGINCGNDCSKSYTSGTNIVLTATADSGREFKSWAGCDSVTGNTCTVTMDSDKTVFPAFASLNISLKSNTKILDDDTMQYLVMQEDTTYFFDPQATAVSALSPGDLIISGSGEGIICRVTAVSTSSDGLIVVETTGASLEDAIAEGTIAWNEKLTHADLKSSKPLMKGVSLRKPQKLTSSEFTVDINSTIEGVNITGNATTVFEPIFNVDFALLSGLKEFKSGLIITNSQSLKLETGGEISFPDRKVAIWEYSFKTITVWTPTTPPLPITLTPKVTVYIGASGSAEAALTTSVNMEARYTAGVRYKKGEGWDKINDFSRKFSADAPNITASAELKGYVLPEITLFVYKAAGPFANVEGYLKAKASASAAPAYLKWGIYGGISASAGLKTSEFLSELLDFELEDVASIKVYENEWPITEKTVGTISDTTPPSAPLYFTASAISSNKINLAWNESSDNVGVKGYKVYRNGSLKESITTTSVIDTNLNPATTYCYKVAAYDDAGNESGQSGEDCSTTSPASDTDAPSVPSGLNAAAVSSSQINLSWNASSDNVKVAGYKIYRNDIPLAKSVTTGSFSDIGLIASTQYCYTVYAFDKAGNKSAKSDQACVATSAEDNNGDFGAILGEFNGVSAYSNGSSSNNSKKTNYVDNIHMGTKWQCVEYVRRYYYSIYGLNLSSMLSGDKAHAMYWYDNASVMGLESYPNGKSLNTPQVGDILVSKGGSYGHIAIIRSVSNNEVCTIQQNFSNDTNDVNRCLTMSNINGMYKVEGFNSNYPIQGWLRKPTAGYDNTKKYTLNVYKSGAGSGTVTSSPAGINCGSDCSEAYNSGTAVTLTATASSGSTFAGWSGCSGTGACTVTMDASMTVTATFNQVSSIQQASVTSVSPFVGTYTKGGNITVTWSSSGISSSALMKISLKRDSYTGSTEGSNYKVLTTGTSNDGSESFTIPTTITTASNWRVWVVDVNGTAQAAYASGTITINDPASAPNAPSISAPSSATQNQAVSITITRGTDPNGDQVKVQCTGSGSNYTDSSPYISSWSTGGTTTTASFTFSSTGTQTIYCTSFDSGGASSGTASRSITVNAAQATVTVPSAPTGVSASADNGQVTISWSSVSGATSYNIYWSISSGVTKTNGTKITGVTSPYAHTGRTNGTTYYYIVTAVNSAGESSASSQVSATPQANSLSTPSLSSPSNGATGQSKTLTLDWGDVSGATTYRIFIAASSSTLSALSSTSTTCSSCLVNTTTSLSQYSISSGTLSASTPYYWMVRAGNSSAGSPNSSIWSFTTANDGNSSPTSPSISSSPSSATQNQLVSITVTRGTDPDGNSVKVQCTGTGSNYPSGSPYDSGLGSGGTSATVSFTFSSTGTQTIYCTSFDSNGAASGTASRTITVNAPTNNAPTTPTISSSPSSATQNQSVSITVTRGTDPDGNSVKVQCTGTGSNYPSSSPYDSGLGSGGTSATVSFTFSSTGTQTIYCTSFDSNGAASGTASRTITVNAPTNNAPTTPTISSSPSSATQNQAVSITVTRGTDPDGNSVKVQCTGTGSNYSGSSYDSGLGSGGTSATVSFTFSSTGTQTIYCTSFDSNGAASSTASRTITVNAASPSVTSISPTSVTLNQLTTFTYYGSNLTSGMGFWIADCSGVTEIGGTSTYRQWRCTPSYSRGSKSGAIKNVPGGTTLYNFTISVN